MTTTKRQAAETTTVNGFSPLFIANIVLVLAAVGISGYMTYAIMFAGEIACQSGPIFNCGAVEASIYSKMFGIPVALIGLVFNVGLLSAFVLEDRITLMQEYGPLLLFGALLAATLFSIWLIIVQAFILNTYCTWCLAHEVVVFALFGIAIFRVRQHMLAEEAV